MTPDERRRIEQSLLPVTPLRMRELAESDMLSETRGRLASHGDPDDKYADSFTRSKELYELCELYGWWHGGE